MSIQQPAGLPPQQPVKPTNPFAGLGVRDVLRDLAALVFLVAALFYRWNFDDSGENTGAELWFVDVTLVLALAGLSLTYLWKLGVLGARWNVGSNQLYRLLATVPYLISVLVVVIYDIADDRSVGVGVTIGVFGAVLAAQPRTHELPPSVLAPSDRIWLQVAGGLGILAALTIALSTLLFIDDLDDFLGVKSGGIVVFVISGLIVAVAVAIPAVWTILARPAGVALLAGTGLVVLVLALLQIDGQGPSQLFGFIVLPGGSEALDAPGFGAFLLTAAAAAALSPGASRATGGALHPISLVGAAKGAFVLIALTSVVHVLAVIFVLAGFEGAELEGPGITTIVVYVLATGAGVLGFLTTAPHTAKTLPIAAAGAFVTLIVIQSIVIAIIDEGYIGYINVFAQTTSLSADSWLAAVIVALAIVVALVGPQAVFAGARRVGERVQVANDPNATQGAPLPAAPIAPAPAPSPAAPVPPVPPAPEEAPLVPTPTAQIPAVDPIVLQASDPSTSQSELARIAEHHPQARAAVAANPNAYPGLLQWLGSIGDPEIDAALRNRQA